MSNKQAPALAARTPFTGRSLRGSTWCFGLAAALVLASGSPAHAGLDPSGELDPTFDQDGVNSTNFALVNTFAEARGVAVQRLGANAGKIVVGGGYQDGFNTHFALLRMNANGTQDFGFGTGGQVKHTVGAVYGGDTGFNGTSASGAAHQVLAAADLALTVESVGDSARPGDEIAYALTYENKTGWAVASVFISETVPQNTSFVAVGSSPGWSCVPGVTAGSVCTLQLGSFEGLDGGVLGFVVRVDSELNVTIGQSISNTAVIGDADDQTGESQPGDNSSTDLIALLPPLTPTPTATPTGPAATPTRTPAGPGATPTGSPNGPSTTPTGIPANPTATPVGTAPQVSAMNGPFWLWASLILGVGIMGPMRRRSGRTDRN